MDIQYKPTKPKKEKPSKVPKAPKAEKAVKFTASVQSVKTSKPAKEPKAPKMPKAEKAVSFGKTAKVQTEKPMKVEKAGKKPGFLSKVDPKLLLGAGVLLVAVIAVIVLTVVLPGIEKQGMEVKSIAITKIPDKVVYTVGEEADYDGLRVQVIRNNGETFTVRASACQISGFDSSKATDGQVIIVSYNGFMASFSISIKESPKPKPVLESIELYKLPKTEYKVGQTLDTTGGALKLHYSDGSELRVNLTNQDVFGFDAIKGPGTYTLTVKYKENGVIVSTTYTITVTG